MRNLLRLPNIYRSLSWVFNVESVHKDFLRKAGYRPGLKVLDIGCGPGDLSCHVAAEDYTGIDISDEYIQFAKTHRKGEFHVMTADRVGELKKPFDLALMFGVFHHLNDDEVRTTLRGIEQVLRPTGHFTLLEAVWPTHSWDLPGYFIRRMDRGKFVRDSQTWQRLLGERWTLANVRVSRNRLIEYFECDLYPPQTPEVRHVA